MYLTIDYDKTKNKGIIKSEFLENIRFHFSEEDKKQAMKKRLYKRRFIADRRHIITQSGRFDLGLFWEILKYLKELKTPFQLVLSEEFKQVINTKFPWVTKEIVDDKNIYLKSGLSLVPRPYQAECISKMLYHGSGTILMPTASGKTPVIALFTGIANNFDSTTKTLIITLPHLIKQIYDEFVNNGYDPTNIAMWDADYELNPAAKIVICSNSILYYRIDNVELNLRKNKEAIKGIYEIFAKTDLSNEERKMWSSKLTELETDKRLLTTQLNVQKETIPFFNSINLLIVDEVHIMKKDNEFNVITDFIRTKHYYGFTGTLPASQIDVWNIFGKVGPLIFSEPRESLVANNYIADTLVKILAIFYKDSPQYEPLEKEKNAILNYKYQKESEFLHQHPFRNTVIKKMCASLEKNVLIIVDRIDHGEHLFKVLSTLENKRVYFIQGEVENDIRDDIKKEMEQLNNVICIAISKIFSTGVNIKNLPFIMLASSGKAKEKIIQSIGRGVRLHPDKKKLIFIDIADVLIYGISHLKERIKLYEDEKIKYEITKIRE